MSDTITDNLNFLGRFATIDEVYAAYPSGGVAGNYVIVANDVLYWDESTLTWEGQESDTSDNPMINGTLTANEVVARDGFRTTDFQEDSQGSALRKINGHWRLSVDEINVRNGDSFKGQSSFTSFVFMRSLTQPNKPAYNDGNYNIPVPQVNHFDGDANCKWRDGVPTGSKPVWFTSRIFTNDGQAPQESSWHDVTLLADTDTSDFELSGISADENPGTPATNPNDWHDPKTDALYISTHEMNWMAIRIKVNAQWGSWSVFKIRGEKGEDGRDGTDGADGQDGATGASLLFCGDFNPNGTYHWNAYRRDYVIHQGACCIVNVKTGDNGSTSLGTPAQGNTNWLIVPKLPAIATELLLAENGHIDLLSGNMINLFNTQNQKVSSLNYDGNGSNCMYYPESGRKRMEDCFDGFRYYYNDDTENTVAWMLGPSGEIIKPSTVVVRMIKKRLSTDPVGNTPAYSTAAIPMSDYYIYSNPSSQDDGKLFVSDAIDSGTGEPASNNSVLPNGTYAEASGWADGYDKDNDSYYHYLPVAAVNGGVITRRNIVKITYNNPLS